MKLTLFRPFDHVPLVPIATLLAGLTLEKVSQVLSLLALLAGLGYTVTKWFLLFKRNRRQLLHPFRD